MRRFPYPFDLEWMEAGMLAHAWRVGHGQAIYGPPNADFTPYVYPPGYPWVLAALAPIFGLGMQLGRAISIAAIAAAAAAIAFGLRRAGAGWILAACTAVAFLGTYPQAGAFYDIVRPDALALALLAWAIVIGLEERAEAPIVAGLLLAAAFVVKHNAAIAGVPMLVGLAFRGPRPALAFAVAAIAPALALVAVLQWTTGGHFLTWLVEVPASQNLLWIRARIDTPREWGTALPIAAGLCGLAACWDAAAHQRAIPPWLAAGVPTWAGIGVAWWYTYEPPPPDAPVYNTPAALAYWALIAAPLALCLRAAGTAIDRARDGAPLPSWRAIYGVGVLLSLGAMAVVMRVHDGGFVNVHTPLFWSLTAAFGAVLLALDTSSIAGARPMAAAALTAQLAWSLALIRPQRLIPTAEDTALGWRIVDELREIDGPILSPFSAWLPVYAGHPPSLHAQGIWDTNYPGGPYQDDLVVIEQALRDHHWTLIIGGQSTFFGDLTRHYEVREELVPENDPRLIPRTGMAVRPWRILVPRP